MSEPTLHDAIAGALSTRRYDSFTDTVEKVEAAVREWFASQPVTDAEVEAAGAELPADSQAQAMWFRWSYGRRALEAARAARTETPQ